MLTVYTILNVQYAPIETYICPIKRNSKHNSQKKQHDTYPLPSLSISSAFCKSPVHATPQLRNAIMCLYPRLYQVFFYLYNELKFEDFEILSGVNLC